ncbi:MULTISPECIES: Era-like GTP-binding protein [Pseudanabaena]|uniref:Era-like GTP-binding protein n=1 Tax=Pseudanabaena TaxID=1152 RepID=UPI00247A2BBA|nr:MULTISPECIES: Era-like GTP-binding protein [Pseudanabaena]MEA5489192.1 Era-like GTP-binding protein [Pseudanabaena sp. CCNP1317]WGS73777.1 Era-like GTP-binding protein [Pseudanabaena galeata CCNP1313]
MQDYLQQVRDRLITYRNLFNQELKESELAEISFLEEKLDKCAIAIAVFGMVSRGKSSLINALLGQKLSETGAIHGITKDIAVYAWDILSPPTPLPKGEGRKKIQLRLIDTQGIDEVGGEVRGAIALEAAKQADLILFVIAGDMTRLEQEAIANLQKTYKPVLLVFNKTDLYPECDRVAIHQALQNVEMRKLISPQEIVLTSVEPKPVKVRIQYSDGRDSQEIWEQPKPDVQALKERILELLNTEGKELLAVNVLRSLLEIQNTVTQRYVQRLQASTAIASLVFIIEAIAVLISPLRWVDGLISGGITGLFVIWAIGRYPSQKKYLWLFLTVAIACMSGGLGINNEVTRYVQIIGLGLSLLFLFKSLITDIEQSRASGKLGAKTLITAIIQAVPEGSILQRLQNM